MVALCSRTTLHGWKVIKSSTMWLPQVAVTQVEDAVTVAAAVMPVVGVVRMARPPCRCERHQLTVGTWLQPSNRKGVVVVAYERVASLACW